MSRDWRLFLLWIAILVAVVGSGAAYANMPAVKCDRIGGQWIADRAMCLCNGEYLTF
jgi:hypothetical protein